MSELPNPSQADINFVPWGIAVNADACRDRRERVEVKDMRHTGAQSAGHVRLSEAG
jgi:hypothetical protein